MKLLDNLVSQSHRPREGQAWSGWTSRTSWAWGSNMQSGDARPANTSPVALADNTSAEQGRRKAALLCLWHTSPLCAPTTGEETADAAEESGELHRPGGPGEGAEETLAAAVLA